MANHPGPSASLIISLTPWTRSEELLKGMLEWAERFESLAPSLQFPGRFLASESTSPEQTDRPISPESRSRLAEWCARAEGRVVLDGFSGAAEPELPPKLLDLERRSAAAVAEEITKKPTYMPQILDTQRPWSPRPAGYSLDGWLRTEDWTVAVLSGERGAVRLPIIADLQTQPSGKRAKWLTKALGAVRRREGASAAAVVLEVREHGDLARLHELGQELLDAQAPKPTLRWVGIGRVLDSLPAFDSSDSGPLVLAGSKDEIGWANLPCRTALVQSAAFREPSSAGRRRQLTTLESLCRSCSDEDLPHRIGEPAPERELVASMLGSASLNGDSMEVRFAEGNLNQMSGSFGRTRGAGYRVPGMELENRRLYWTAESAFSFETENSRGLRQISTLSSDLFTLSGRAVADFFFQDDFPALVVDIRIQHPWIEKSLQIDRYLPWNLGTWDIPRGESAEVYRHLDDGAPVPVGLDRGLEILGRKPSLAAKIGGRLPFRREELRFEVPGHFWDVETKLGTLRVRRADSLLSTDYLVPAVLVASPHSQGTALTLCPTRSYAKLHSWHLKGLYEHFALLVYDPRLEDQVRSGASQALREKVFSPWILRS